MFSRVFLFPHLSVRHVAFLFFIFSFYKLYYYKFPDTTLIKLNWALSINYNAPLNIIKIILFEEERNKTLDLFCSSVCLLVSFFACALCLSTSVCVCVSLLLFSLCFLSFLALNSQINERKKEEKRTKLIDFKERARFMQENKK